MQVYNMLEKEDGKGYRSGNIRLVKITKHIVEVFTRKGEVIKYKRVVV